MAAKTENAYVTQVEQSSSMMDRSSSPLSPFSYSHYQEVTDIRNSNDRMATLVEAIRASEIEKARLNAIVQSFKETSDRDKTNIKRIYEDKLFEVRKKAEELFSEKEKLALDVERLWYENVELKQRNDEYYNEALIADEVSHSTNAKLIDATNRFNGAVADRKKSLAKVKNLKNELRKVKAQQESHRAKLGREVETRIELENKLQALRDDRTLTDQVHLEELNNSSIRLDVSWDLTSQVKFTDELKQLRNQCEADIRLNRSELESHLIMKMENELNSSQRENKSLKTALSSMYDRMDASHVRVDELEQSNASLNARIRELQSSLDGQVALTIESENEMSQLRKEFTLRFRKYQELIDMKISTDVERAAYDKLLAGGEHLLKITPAAKRSRNEFDVYDYSVESSSLGRIELSLSVESAEVKLQNRGETDVSLGGWKLIRKAGKNETVHTFECSDKINSGGDITVWSAENDPSTSIGEISLRSENGTFADKMKTTLFNGDGEVEATVERIRKERSPRFRQIRQEVLQASEKCILM